MLKIIKCAKCGHWQELDDELTCHECDADFHQANSYYTASNKKEEAENRKKFDRMGENIFNDVMHNLQERIDEYQFKTCPHCGKQVLKTEKKCQSCGHTFKTEDSSIEAAQRRIGIIISAACIVLMITMAVYMTNSYNSSLAEIKSGTVETTDVTE